jgi:hypothetical protein
MFGSIFGAAMSLTLLGQAWSFRRDIAGGKGISESADFWFRHGLWFSVMHLSFVVVGVFAIGKLTADWANFIVLVVLLAIPLVLVYRSYDSLRLHSRERRRVES